MHEAGLDISEEFYAYKERASGYIARASHFPFQWGLPNGAKNKNGFPIEFFRWDRRVLKRMVDRAEHIIRCLIIWMAWARLRSGLVEPVYSPLLGRNPSGSGRPAPSLCSCGANTDECVCGAALSTTHREAGGEAGGQNQNARVHHLYSIRGLPLYDLRVAPFKVSLPSETTRSSLRTQGSGNDVPDSRFRGNERNPSRSGRSKRTRNDKVFSSEILIMRMERLGKLYDEIDTRAARIAGLWLGRMSPNLLARDPRRASDALRPTLGRDGPYTSDCAGAECPETQTTEPHSSKQKTSADPNENWGPRLNSGNEPDETSDAWKPASAGISGDQESDHAPRQLSRSPERASGIEEKPTPDPGSSPGKAGMQTSDLMSSRAQCGTKLRSADTGPEATAPPGSGPGSAPHHSVSQRVPSRKRRMPRSGRSELKITPIKSPDPPPDMMEGAPDDERDDVLALHDGAIRAAELFTQHCV